MKYILAIICFVGSMTVAARSDDVSLLQSFTTLRFANIDHLDFATEYSGSEFIGTWRNGEAHNIAVSENDARKLLLVDGKDSSGASIQLKIRLLKVRERVFLIATDAPRLSTSIPTSVVCEVVRHKSGEVELSALQPSVFADAGFRATEVGKTVLIIPENSDGSRFLKCLESAAPSSPGLMITPADL